MSTFSVKVIIIDEILNHPNADRLEIAKVMGFDIIVAKNKFKKGDIAAYIPEASIVPNHTAEEIGVLGKLDGKKKNRVKVVALRGIYSQGLLYPIERIDERNGIITSNKNNIAKVKKVELGEDVSEFLEIEKYRVEVPPMFEGDIFPIDLMERISFDIENIKNYPDLIKEGEEVIFTEKLHGTFTHVVYLPPAYIKRENINYPDAFQSENGIVMVSSKQQSHNGYIFKKEGANSERNVYLKAVIDNDLLNKLPAYFVEYNYPVIVLAETFGPHIQDLNYGVYKGESKGFRIFSIYTKEDNARFKPINSEELDNVLEIVNLERVPILYKGKFSKDIMDKFTNGKETISGKQLHIREGIVISPLIERYDNRINHGRVILKNISMEYLIRTGGTEFN